MAFYQALDWHEGEDKIHKLTHVPKSDNPTHPMLIGPLARRVALSPTIALGATDDQGQVWCTIWGGDVPIAQQVARGVIGVRTQVDASYDPVVQALYSGTADGEVVRNNKMVSGLSINLEERDRVKLFGKMVAGSLDLDEPRIDSTDPGHDPTANRTSRTGNAQLVLHITQSLGNCPKYLNKKEIKSHASSRPRLISDSCVLSAEAIEHVHNADIFFVASRGPEDMDCNHRGGPPGFVRVHQQSSGNTDQQSSVLVWPEYSGNNLYQTLGNLSYTPEAGICIPDFVTGTVLYLTGTAEILIGAAASAILTKTKLAVRFTVKAARFVSEGLMFRGTPCTDNRDISSSKPNIHRAITDGMSPYNPKVRYLVSELEQRRIETVPPDEFADRTVSAWRDKEETSATLVKKTKLTPTITKYRFHINNARIEEGAPPLWTPGQYVALDFSDELYMGYSHMRDDDPGALNDDFIRTFTVASSWNSGARQVEFEVIVRNVGSVTKWLSWQNDRSGMTKVGVRGFAGDFRFDMSEGRDRNVFIAAGIGITPLLGQIEVAAGQGLVVLWSLHVRDIGLVEEVLGVVPDGLDLRIFVTGTRTEDSGDESRLRDVEALAGRRSIGFERRRLQKDDLKNVESGGEGQVGNWYLCTAPKMRAEIQQWLEGQTVLFENFDY